MLYRSFKKSITSQNHNVKIMT